MQAYSMDLRQRVIAACDQKQTTKSVAQRFGVSAAWVRRLKQHRRERGDIKPRTGGQPDATLVELRERLGVAVTPWAISKALRELKLAYKKSRFTPPSRIGRTSPSGGQRGA